MTIYGREIKRKIGVKLDKLKLICKRRKIGMIGLKLFSEVYKILCFLEIIGNKGLMSWNLSMFADGACHEFAIFSHIQPQVPRIYIMQSRM